MCSIKNNNLRSRLVWLDLLKGFCMIMIILNHTSNRAAIYARLYVPVFLSSFFFALGYTFKSREDFKHYFINKIKSLGIPFICLGLINAFLAIMAEGDSVVDRLKYLIFIRLVWDDLWFVACLFTMQFIFYVIYKISGILRNKFRINDCFAIAVLSFILSTVSCKIVSITGIRLPLQFENACICTFSMALGYIYKMNECVIDNIITRIRGAVIAYYSICNCLYIYS
ncbi:MAG: acyltransferase [Odoribacter sp.]|nr:acyltransferase [Odoribacter sp.]